MHVLMIAQFFPPHFGGAGTRAYNLAKALVIQGCAVTVVTAFRSSNNNNEGKSKKRLSYTEDFEGMKIVRTRTLNLTYSPLSLFFVYISFVFSSLLGMYYVRKIDVIFVMNPIHFAMFSAVLYKIFFRKNIIGSVDDLWPEVFYDSGAIRSRSAKKFLDFVASVCYKLQSTLIPVSQGYVNTLITKYHIPEEKIVVIEPGVDITKFNAIKNPEKSNNKKIIMYSGYIGRDYYDMETVIKAASRLQSENILFILRGFGGDPVRIKQTIDDYKVKNVEFRMDVLPRDQAISAMKMADIFLLPMSLVMASDLGLPTKVLEYQALGKPIICISKGEPGRYIMRTESGLLMKSNDPEILADLIMKLLNDNNLAYQLGKNGLDYVNNNLTLEKIGERLMNIIHKVSQKS